MASSNHASDLAKLCELYLEKFRPRMTKEGLELSEEAAKRIYYVRTLSQYQKVEKVIGEETRKYGLLSWDVERDLKTQEPVVVQAATLTGHVVIFELRSVHWGEGYKRQFDLPESFLSLMGLEKVTIAGSDPKEDVKKTYGIRNVGAFAPYFDTQVGMRAMEVAGMFKSDLGGRTGFDEFVYQTYGLECTFKPRKRIHYVRTYGKAPADFGGGNPRHRHFGWLYDWKLPPSRTQMAYLYYDAVMPCAMVWSMLQKRLAAAKTPYLECVDDITVRHLLHGLLGKQRGDVVWEMDLGTFEGPLPPMPARDGERRLVDDRARELLAARQAEEPMDTGAGVDPEELARVAMEAADEVLERARGEVVGQEEALQLHVGPADIIGVEDEPVEKDVANRSRSRVRISAPSPRSPREAGPRKREAGDSSSSQRPRKRESGTASSSQRPRKRESGAASSSQGPRRRESGSVSSPRPPRESGETSTSQGPRRRESGSVSASQGSRKRESGSAATRSRRESGSASCRPLSPVYGLPEIIPGPEGFRPAERRHGGRPAEPAHVVPADPRDLRRRLVRDRLSRGEPGYEPSGRGYYHVPDPQPLRTSGGTRRSGASDEVAKSSNGENKFSGRLETDDQKRKREAEEEAEAEGRRQEKLAKAVREAEELRDRRRRAAGHDLDLVPREELDRVREETRRLQQEARDEIKRAAAAREAVELERQRFLMSEYPAESSSAGPMLRRPAAVEVPRTRGSRTTRWDPYAEKSANFRRMAEAAARRQDQSTGRQSAPVARCSTSTSAAGSSRASRPPPSATVTSGAYEQSGGDSGAGVVANLARLAVMFEQAGAFQRSRSGPSNNLERVFTGRLRGSTGGVATGSFQNLKRKIPAMLCCRRCGGQHPLQTCYQSIEPCTYELCLGDKSIHNIAACMELHRVCSACCCRGHRQGHPLCPKGSGEEAFREMRDRFEAIADAGHHTRTRHWDPKWGFFHFGTNNFWRRYPEGNIPYTYAELLSVPVFQVHDWLTGRDPTIRLDAGKNAEGCETT